MSQNTQKQLETQDSQQLVDFAQFSRKLTPQEEREREQEAVAHLQEAAARYQKAEDILNIRESLRQAVAQIAAPLIKIRELIKQEKNKARIAKKETKTTLPPLKEISAVRRIVSSADDDDHSVWNFFKQLMPVRGKKAHMCWSHKQASKKVNS